MLTPVSRTEIQQLKDRLAAGDGSNVYADLQAAGYQYAGWGKGVFDGDTISGISALDFVQGTALDGLGGPQCKNLSPLAVDKIKLEMAGAYLDALDEIARKSGTDTADRDINAKEVWKFHESVLKDNNLSIDNWTLNAVFKLRQKDDGDQGLENYWQMMRDTGGGTKAVPYNALTLWYMYNRNRTSPDPEVQEMTRAWLNNVPGFFDEGQRDRFMEVLEKWMKINGYDPSAYDLWSTASLVLLATIMPGTNVLFLAAVMWILRKDPLTLDLDGDGLETLGIDKTNPILFDHEGDGIKTATGWVGPDDGFLTLDRNGNGMIDDGTELFGDSTPLYAGGTAEDGFAALAQEDTNGDGLVNAADANFANLRIWRDLNQNGLSEEGELLTLEESGIAALRTTKTEHSANLANGNQVADLGGFIKADGTEGGMGAVAGEMGDINLADNPFYSEFTDNPPLTDVALGLPGMNGSGQVRDLQSASVLSPDLTATLGGLAGYHTRAELLSQADALIAQWAATSGMETGVQKAASVGKNLIYLAPGQTIADLQLFLFSSGSGAPVAPAGFGQTPAEAARKAALVQAQADITNLIALLERFNGMTFVNIKSDAEIRTGANALLASFTTANPNDPWEAGFGIATPPYVFVPISTAQWNLLQQSYDALKQSVYDGLVMQTRLKPYLDTISLQVSDTGIQLDFAPLAAELQARFETQPAEAVRDLLDVQRVAGAQLTGSGWDGYQQLRGWLGDIAAMTDPAAKAALTATIIAGLNDFGYGGLRVNGDGTGGSEAVIGDDAGAVLNGAGGNDLVLGGNGDDVLNGGTGNDSLYGGAGNDTYVFNLGDGADTIVETQGDVGSDGLQLGTGVIAGELDIYIDGDKLVFAHANGRDKVSIANWFDSLSDSAHRLDTVRFADGALLNLDALQLGTDGADTLIGTSQSDILMGGAGDDILISDGNDWLNGGTGADSMTGSIGDDMYVVDNAGDVVIELADEGTDTVYGRVSATLADNVENLVLVGSGNSSGTGNGLDNTLTGNGGSNALYGGDGNDTLIGNGGNDLLDGGSGADVMSGGTGDDGYVVDVVEDTVTELAGQGIDTVSTGLDYTLGANVENLTLTGTEAVAGTGNELSNILTGNAADNTLTGLAGSDTLNGGLGADTMLGGVGNDTYVVESVGDSVVEAGVSAIEEGTDLVQSGISYTLTDNVENLTLAGAENLDGTGNVLDNVILGNSGDNTLLGLEGNDTLNGGQGVDSLVGGVGNDTYVIDSNADVVVENVGEGTDTVQSAISYTLGANLENLTLIGAGGSAIGNELNNVIVGSGYGDVLDGGIGADTLSGGDGGDTYLLDNLGDTVIETGSRGTDTVIAPFDYTLTANVEDLTLTGEALNGTGNALGNAITGTGADNTLTGLAGGDMLDGGAGADLLIGGTGDDTFVVDNAADTPLELTNEGIDTVRSNLTWTLGDNLDNLTLTGADAIDGTGNELDNVITGNAAANTLTALAGNDTLDGGAGADTMTGGTGNDVYVVDDIGDSVVENLAEGTDTVKSSITYTLGNDLENLTLTGSAVIDGTGNELDNVIVGNGAVNTLIGLEGNDLIDGGAGADVLIGGTGNDSYIVDNSADVVVENSDDGADTVYASANYVLADNIETLNLTGAGGINGTGNAQANLIVGNSGGNTLAGGAGDDMLIGNGGNDTLDGGVGADAMTGGVGNDTYVVDEVGDAVSESSSEGTDLVRASIDYTLGANVENLTLTGPGNLAGTGNELDNTLTGNDGDNVLSGQDGVDTLFANAGNDLLDGGANADRMAGGAGDDTYVVDNAGDKVAEAAGEGNDSVLSSVAYTLTDNVENLTLTGSAAIVGAGNTAANVLIGNSADNGLYGLTGNDTLVGNAGNDLLDGGTGADQMAGGTGDDAYVVDEAGDVVSEAADEGVDMVQSGISYTLTDNIENLALTGTEDLAGTGNALNNAIIGTAGNNILDGAAGADMLTGGAGDDSYLVDDSADVVTELAGEGTDSVFASASFTLSDHVENLTLTGSADIDATGNVLDNILTANAGINVLTGGAGNDIYLVNDTADVVVENVNEGNDTVQSSATYTLSDNVENLILTGTDNVDGTGSAQANTITGNAGDNFLDGAAGADAMAGGAGNDSYIVDNTGDVATELGNEGTDIVFSSVSYTLSANVENMTLTGTANIDATGNTLDNVLIGNTGDNKLYGLAGNDTLVGNEGNDLLDGGTGSDAMAGNTSDDSYVVDSAGDTVTELADEGSDTVQSSISYSLGTNVENLVLTGTANLDGTGNELNNAITGNSGANLLDGGAGVDSLGGGAGSDTYVVDETAEVVVEGANAGTDTVLSSATYTLSDNVENLTLTGSVDLDGTGNALANVITANAGLNVLAGGAGNDTYVVNDTADVVVENLSEGTDLVQSSATYTLSDNVENLTLTGAADLDGTGNVLDNIIVANAGINVLTGGAGNDTYVVNDTADVVVENLDEGADLVQSSATYTLSDHVENLTLTGSANIDGTGNALANAILGNSGNNAIDGGLGADVMQGGLGNDSYVVDSTGDAVTEGANAGIDLVQSSVSYALGANLENLTLTGTSSTNGTGNTVGNIILGNSGDNRIDGSTGADTMTGGAGNDIYVVESSGDLVSESVDEGIDTVESSISYTLGANLEHLTLTGTAAINGTGNALANTILGNSAANLIDGGAGVDSMAGGAGNDTYVVNDTADVVTENLNEGTDLVQSSATYTLSANVENLTLTGVANIDGTGNSLNNTIIGNSGNNLIDAGSGADAMQGGTGNDTYIVDNAGDGVTEAANAGTDLVYSSVSYTLTNNVENLTLTTTGAINGTGNTLNNILLGTTGNNRLDGSSGADSMAGNLGNDTYVVENTGDLVTENADEGIDNVESSISYTLTANVENLTLTGTAAINGTGNVLDNVIVGNSGNNVLSGLAGNDSLTGIAGNDTLDGGMGADLMAAGAGNDTYVVDDNGDLVTENLNEGTELVQSSITYTLTANVENLTLTGTANIDGTGNTLNNIITGNSGANAVDASAGDDIVNAGSGDDTASGGDGNDNLAGEAGSDTISGNAGNDIVNGGLDADTMAGGTGNDTYVVDNVGDLVIENAAEGTDLVQSSITYTLTDNTENLTLTGTANIAGTGNVLDNIIIGNTGANALTGLEGNDTLDGGTGADAMTGGTGNDTYIVDNVADTVIESLDEGTDLVQASVSYTLSANVENLTLTGTASINGTGNELANVIVGNSGNNGLSGLAGNDSLTGNAGNDTLDGGLDVDGMAGGAGNDTYVVDNAGDLVTENLNEGTDLVQSSITYTLTANVENLTLTGAALIDGTGNTLNNVITGNTVANVIDAGAGDDTVNAGAGDDALIGGDGNDSLNGEAGNDTMFGNAGNDTLNGGLDADAMAGGVGNDTYVVDNVSDLVIENLNEGTDLVQSSITYTLTDNTENLTLTGTANIDGTGNALNNVVTGNTGSNTLYGLDGNDTLDGSAGADALIGGAGNDTYVVDNAADTVVENLDEGIDLVQASVTYTLAANVENLTLTGTGNINGSGNELANVIVGNTGNNSLAGLAGNDTLTGNAGNDVLDGGLDADTMAGNAGNDTYVVDNAGDVVTEATNEGTDLVQSSITYTLGANVENLTLTGSADLNGTGNTLANVITGNSGNNVLDGGAGADTMIGGAGNDTYFVDNTADVITEGANAGTDSVFAAATYTLSANLENLTLTGSANINGTGNASDNLILGNGGNNTLNGDAGNDSLDGGVGADAMNGGTGNDSYIVDNAGDVVTEAANAGIDTVQAGINYTLTANVETLVLTGAALNGTGNTLNNLITGTAANNTLDGGAGADSLVGGTGDDTYVVDNSADVVTELADEGTDTVLASASYAISDNVENLTLTGTGSINGTGNALDNVITGNSGNNSLSGLAGNDTLTGNVGNDLLDGGVGVDSMAGGLGDDTYVVDDAADVVMENAGEGTDTVHVSFDYTLADALENLTLTGTAQVGAGNTAANVLTGNGADNTLYGLAGNDSLIGNAGNDLLDGGTGADQMAGGADDDTYIVDNAGDGIAEAINSGNDTVLASVDYALSANVENLILTGSALAGTGNAQDNTITGNSGNNFIDGGAGADILAGGAGADVYVVDVSTDVVIENPGEGSDTVLASANFVLSDNVENLTLTGTANLSATGNALDNVLTSNAGIDVLAGLGGNDTYVVGNSADVVIENADEGMDTVWSSASYALSDNIENLVLSGSGSLDGTGNAGDNLIIGNTGGNILDGGAGGDQMIGGTGDDGYVVDNAADFVVEGVGEGTDTVRSSVSHTLAANVENLVLTGTDAIVGAGNTADNVLTGNVGDNVLDGGAGADNMAGGLGDDTYVVDQAGDFVSELSGEGVDTVQSSIGYTLGANVENLTLTGTADLDGNGNAFDNILTGNAGNNVLNGGDGSDTLGGGAGSDILMGGVGSDTYVFQLGDGSDRIVDAQGSDTLFVGSGLNEFNLEAERIGDSLLIHTIGTEDFITLDNWYGQIEGIDRIVFGDGSSLDRTGIDELRNRPPVANADNITVHEDGGALTFAASNLLVNDTDPNPGDVLTVIGVGSSQVGAAVTLADGQISYDIGSAFQDLAEGETVHDSFSYTIADRKGAQAASLVNVDIVGINDAPVTVADMAATVEDTLQPITGNVLTNDSDVDHGTVLRIAALGDFIGAYGTLSLGADGGYAYALANDTLAVQALAQGQVVVDHFAYDATDGMVAVGSSLDIAVTGINDAPVVVVDAGSAAEDGVLFATGNVLANDADVDAGTVLQVASPGAYVGTYGTLILQADGSYAYSLTNDSLAVQSLAGGTSAIDHFAYAATDGLVATDSALDITVQGVNDAPVTANDADIVVEDRLTVATGNVLANDTDVDLGTVLQVANPGVYAGEFGSLDLAVDGAYTYTLNNTAWKVQSLGREAVAVEHFGYTATDGQVGTGAALDVFLHGTNDAPIVVKPLANREVKSNKAFSWQIPECTFKDIDHGDTLTFNATRADGSALPSWLRFDAATRTFSGTAPKKETALDIRITATDKVADSGSTDGSLSVSDVFRLEVEHGNVSDNHDDDHHGGGNGWGGHGDSHGGGCGNNNDDRDHDRDDDHGNRGDHDDRDRERSGSYAYLDPRMVAEYCGKHGDPRAGQSGSNDASIFARWLAMDLAVSKALAENGPSWLDDGHGADTAALSKATSGCLGSTHAFGKDAFSLHAGSGQNLQNFKGLAEGMHKIA